MPTIDWYYNENQVSHKSTNKSAYHIASQRKHSFVKKILIIDNLDLSSSGKYVCKLNNTKVLKSFNLIVKNYSTLGTEKAAASSFKNYAIVIFIIVAIAITIGGVAFYLK